MQLIYKKKGFTLVELLAVIVILSLTIIIGFNAILKAISESKEKAYQEQVNRIIKLSKAYVVDNITNFPEENEKYYIWLDDLKDANLLSGDVINPINNNKLNGCIIITKSQTSFDYEFQEENNCPNIDAIYNITYELDGGILESENPTTYTYNTKTFTLNNPSKTDYIFQGWKRLGSDEILRDTKVYKGTFGDLHFTAIYEEADKVAPVITVTPSSGSYKGSVSVTISVYDVGSGLFGENKYEYYLSTSNTELINGSWKSYESGVPFTITGDGMYYLWVYPVKDKYDNVNDNKTFNEPYVAGVYSFCKDYPEYTYLKNDGTTANSKLIDDGDGNWRLKFLESGTFTLTNPICAYSIDVFLVGGGGGGRWGGGGGGKTDTITYGDLEVGKPYEIVVGTGGAVGGSGGSTSAFNGQVSGGEGGYYKGGNGGSGGGGGTPVIADDDRWGIGGNGGYNGGNGAAGSSGTQSGAGGTGQGKTTCEFSLEVSKGTCYYTDNGYSGFYAGGGGGGGYNIYDSKAGGLGGGGNGGNNNYAALIGVDNTGGGGGGGSNGYGKVGGSGIVIIRNSESYNVKTNYCNVTADRNLRAILPSTTEEIIISTKNGSKLPETVTVTGASYTWDKTTGKLIISNATDNVEITVVGTYYIDTTLEYAYIGSSDKLCITKTGTYEVELYGAEGGIALHGAWCGSEGGVGGLGGSIKFSVELTEGTDAIITVAGAGTNTSQFGVSAPGGYNGGGKGGTGCGVGGTGGSGGGATTFKVNDIVYASANGGGGGGGGCDGSNGECGGKGGTGGYFLGTPAAGGITRTSANCTSCPNLGLCNCPGGNGSPGGYGYDSKYVTFISGESGVKSGNGALKITYKG